MIQELKSIYDTYISSVTARWQNQDFGDIVTTMFSGRGRFGRDSSLEPFLKGLEAFLTRCADQPVDEKTAAAILEYMLFGSHTATPEPAADGLDAADGKALTLIRLLSVEDRVRIYNMYREKLRHRPGLPCQRTVLKELKPR